MSENMQIMDDPRAADIGAWATARTAPDRVAVIGPDGREHTYAELIGAANRIAHRLRELGVGARDVVATFVENSVEHFEVALAADQIGAYRVHINYHLTAHEAAYILADSGAQVLVAHADLAGRLDPLGEALPEARFSIGEGPAGWQPYAELRDAGPDEPPTDRIAGQVMGYTSGTTGHPKGVKRPIYPVTPELLAQGLNAFMSGFGLTKDEGVHLVFSPLYHAAPERFSIGALHLGETVVVMSKFDAEGVLANIEKYGVTSMHVVPTHIHRLLRLPEETRRAADVSSLCSVISAAAPFPVPQKNAALEWFGPVVWEYLAATEGLVCLCSPQDAMSHPGTVGQAPTVKVLDPSGEPVPTGETGIIHFPADNSFEYHNAAEKTAAALRVEGYATVGDMGHLDEDGYLYLADRRDDLIISGGVNVYPAEVEEWLLQHPRVNDVAVIGAPHDDLGQDVVAIIELSEGGEVSDELSQEIQEWIASGLSGAKRPRQVYFTDRLPRTPTGKLLRRVVRGQFVPAADN